jgi:hypothetical protein
MMKNGRNVFFININLFNCSYNCICIVFSVCSVSFILCVVLCAVLCLSVVCYLCDVCYLCVVSSCSTLPPGKNSFAVSIIIIIIIIKFSCDVATLDSK